MLARYVDVAKIEEKKTDISESVQKSVKAETAGIEANVGVEAVGTVGSSADVAAGYIGGGFKSTGFADGAEKGLYRL